MIFLLKAGQTYSFYITGFDGRVPAKLELYAEVVKKITGNKPRLPNFNPFIGLKPKPPSYPQPSLPYNITPVTEKVSINKENITTYLTPVPPYEKRYNYTPQPQVAKTAEVVTAVSSETPTDQRLKAAPDLTTTLVPVLSVLAIFLVVGFIAVMFRKKIYLGRSKDVKEDMVSEICCEYNVFMSCNKACGIDFVSSVCIEEGIFFA